MQTRPGSGAGGTEPEPEHGEGSGSEPAESAERDPFTPKVPPEGSEPESRAVDPDNGEPGEDEPTSEERPEAGSGTGSEAESGTESGAGSEAESDDAPDEEPESVAGEAAEGDRDEAGQAAEEPAEEEPAPRRRSGSGGAAEDGRDAEPAAHEEEPAPRRRSGPPGPPPKRRVGPPPGDARRASGRPPAAHASSEPGPRRRPASGPAAHAAEPRLRLGPGERRPGPERRPAPERRPGPGRVAAKPPRPAAPDPVSLGRRRLFAALWPPRMSRNQVVVGVLLAALGAALAIQVHATNTSDQFLRAARSDDLVHILDDVTARGQRLDAELRDLQTQNAAIQNSADKAQAALAQAQQKAKDLQILAGTVKAKGPGITMTISDPQGQVKAATLLNALEELRAAGAEVIQIGDVRVVVSSALVDLPTGGIALDGRTLSQPYVYKVIGDPNTLQPAMQIPGGVVASVRSLPGASATIVPGQVLVDAVAAQPSPDYAKAG